MNNNQNNNTNMLGISAHHNPLGLFIDTNLHHHHGLIQSNQYHQAMLTQQLGQQLAQQFGHHIQQSSPKEEMFSPGGQKQEFTAGGQKPEMFSPGGQKPEMFSAGGQKEEMFSAGGQIHQKSGKKSRADYTNALCTICNAPADGLHYGAISCRSCNAFFRRAVTFKQTFICRKGGQCDVDVSVRCACRACRLAKCKAAGMRETDVQPKRDPTGSQKNRRAPQRKRGTQMNGGGGLLMVKKEPNEHMGENSPTSLLPSVESDKVAAYLSYMGPMGEVTESNPYHSSISFPPSAESGIFEESTGTIQFLKTIKKEEEPIGDEEEEEQEGDEEEEEEEEEDNSQMQSSSSKAINHRSASSKDDKEQAEFEKLVKDYREHLLWMNRSLTPIKDFLSEEFGSCSKWRMMEPKDVEPLNKVELGGLMYWIDKLWPFRLLEPKEREVIFKRYSIRKISLDHFYTASKHQELLEKGHFAMPNNTYVPPDRTGFETLQDDEHTREAKFQILRPTIDRIWHSIVLPFANLKITDAEIVAIQLLQMWSPSNNRLLSEKTRQMMVTRRDWTIKRLYRHLQDSGHPEPSVRLGEILLFMPELEVIYDMHSKDFQVAQLFEFCNMSDYWYESYYYTNLNIA